METQSYKSIFKATSLFGGVKVIQIFLTLLRGKIIALLLGPSGVGLNSLFMSPITMISNITSLGLNFSAVRDIAKANESGDINKLSIIIKIFKRWILATAVIGLLSVVVFSRILSNYTFKNPDYTISFVLLSFVVFFGALTSGNASILQGTRNLKSYAMHSLAGSFVALIVSAPLYYFYGTNGIVPALIISSIITFFYSVYYVLKVKTANVNISINETYKGGKEMLQLGLTMMLATSIGSAVHYFINTFISSHGSIADLGFYQAGMSIISQSVGLVFSAMAIDYYPRLAAISEDNNKVRKMANQQGEITMLITAPVLASVIIFTPLVINILLSSDFLIIINFIRVLSLGMIFKAASYSIGAISFAKGDKKVFFFLEGIYMNASILLFSILGYKINGLMGLAIGYLLMHLIYFVIINIVTYVKYDFYISKDLIKILSISILLVTSLFLSSLFVLGVLKHAISISILIILFYYCYYNLDKLIGIKEMLSKVFRRQS
ncbi:MAG: oligosaccharide flippase family protein [Bacteroidales bacterium]